MAPARSKEILISKNKLKYIAVKHKIRYHLGEGDNMTHLTEQLKSFSLFEGMVQENIQSVLHCIGYTVRTYNKGEFISLTSEQVKWVGIPLTGSVQVLKEDLWGDRVILASISQGQVFGETFACSRDTVSTVSFLSAETSQILFLPFHQLLTSCGRSCAFHHRLIENMVTLIAEKNFQLMEKIEIISKKSLRAKILTYLGQEARQNGSLRFEAPFGRVALAEYLGADRSALTRELHSMKADGLIEFHKNTFTLLQPQAGGYDG